MKDIAEHIAEEETAEAVADALQEQGLEAFPQDTGGGITCVMLEHKGGGEISWGTADVTWGAVISDADGEYLSSIRTDCPSDGRDVAAIAAELKRASIDHGAVQQPSVQ